MGLLMVIGADVSFVSTSIGFMYLHHAHYIERELDNWLQVRAQRHIG